MTLLRANLWPVSAAIVVGFVLLPVAQREYTEWDRERAERSEREAPVVTMRGMVLKRQDGAAFVRLTGTKHRDCRYLSMDAYSVTLTGVRHLANIERADEISEDRKTRPPGIYDFGVWRVWPVVDNAVGVAVFVEHVCNHVAVRTLAAEVTL